MSEWLPSSHLRAIPRVVERVDQVRSFILQETFLFQSLPPSLKATRRGRACEIEDGKWPGQVGEVTVQGRA